MKVTTKHIENKEIYECKIKNLCESLRFIEDGCTVLLEEHELNPLVYDIVDEFRQYAKLREKIISEFCC